MIERRAVIAGVLCVAAVMGAWAQQKARIYRIAMVSPSHPLVDMTETGSLRYYRAFFQRLRELGYVEGETLAVARYSAEGRTERFSELVHEAVDRKPELIFASGDRLARELKAATATIPVITIVSDPVAAHVATSLARPDGNITGVSIDPGIVFYGKYLELLHEMVPAASRVGWLSSRVLWEESTGVAIREAAQKLKISLVGPQLEPPLQQAEYRRVFAALSKEGAEAVIVTAQPENITNRQLIVELAERLRLPAIYPYRDFTHIGGLISYGVDLSDLFRHMADQVDEILKGTKPSDIPFYQPTKFELTINLKTAKALGITVPPTLLIAADEVIE
jgi:putative tryptophan/tyrosine transport system substrate-binding protein